MQRPIILEPMKQDTEFHRCNLPGEPWDIVTRYIEGGVLVQLRRQIKRCMMISENHPLTRGYAPSLARLNAEDKAHLFLHYFMIHPLSMFAFHFKLLVCLIFLMAFLVAPPIYSIVISKSKMSALMVPMNVVYVTLMMVTISMGYYDTQRNIVVMKRSAAIKRYLKTYFVVDLISVMPIVFEMDLVTGYLQYWPLNMIPSFIPLVRYFRYIWCIQQLQIARVYYGISNFTFKALKMLLNILCFLIVSMYIMVNLVPRPDKDLRSFLGHAEATVKMLLMISSHHRFTIDPVMNNVVPIMFIFLGFIFHLLVIVQTREIWMDFSSAENQQTLVYDSVNAYMRYRALPMTIRKRIHLYLEFKYQGHFFKESVIRKATSNSLKREILLAATKNRTQRVDLFSQLPIPVLKKIRSVLVSEIFLPGDVIIKAGNPGQCMFFLLAGTVVVTSSEGKPICYLRDGAHFGEVALVVNIARVANVIAVTPCELFKLDRRNFWDIMKKYPDMWKEIEEMATDRIADAARASVGDAATVPYKVDSKKLMPADQGE